MWTSFLGTGGKLARVLGFGVINSLLQLVLHIQLLPHHQLVVPWPGFALPACLEEVIIGCMAVPGGVLLPKDRLLVECHGLLMSLAQVASVGVEVDVPSWSGSTNVGARVDHVHQACVVLVHCMLEQSVVCVCTVKTSEFPTFNSDGFLKPMEPGSRAVNLGTFSPVSSWNFLHMLEPT